MNELDSDADTIIEDEINVDDLSEEIVNVDFADYLDSLEETSQIDLDKVLGELTAVEYGCKIHIHEMPQDKFFISNMPMVGEELNMLQKKFLGKPIGYVWKIGTDVYEIVDLRR